MSRVRIAEFAWSRIEPRNGAYDWDWLDRAIETLAEAGLQVVMCTPTATPPKWLVDAYPDVLAVDATGAPRRFGSRRHYCFSSPTYRRESARITEAVAVRYGGHPAVTAWQTDNEYGCHDTVLSYSPNAVAAFRLRDRCRRLRIHRRYSLSVVRHGSPSPEADTDGVRSRMPQRSHQARSGQIHREPCPSETSAA